MKKKYMYQAAELEEVRRVPNHRCDLPLKPDMLMSHYIDDGYFVGLRRWFRKSLMSNVHNPESKIYLKSTAAVERDHVKHLKYHYYMIHPFSAFRFHWEMVMLFVYTISLLATPIDVILVGFPIWMMIAHNLIQLMLILDIVLFFCTGYVNSSNGSVVMNPWKVCKAYMFSYFIFDLLSSAPYKTVTQFSGAYEYRRFKCLLLLKVVRVPTVHLYLTKLFRKYGFPDYLLKSITFLSWIFFAITYTTAIIIQIRSAVENWQSYNTLDLANMTNMFNMVLREMYYTLADFLLVGPPNSRPTVVDDYQQTIRNCLDVVLLLCGSGITMVLIANMSRVYAMYNRSTSKRDKLLNEVRQFIKYKDLSPGLAEKIIDFIEYKQQNESEDIIFRTLNKSLLEDILYFKCQQMIEKVSYFKDMPYEVLTTLATKLRSEIFIPNDIVVQAHSTGNCMYFIHSGEVAVYTDAGKEIVHLEEGDNFGEIALLMNAPRVATVKAITECELLKLYRKDFLDVMNTYPDLKNKIYNVARDRFLDTAKIMSGSMSIIDSVD